MFNFSFATLQFYDTDLTVKYKQHGFIKNFKRIHLLVKHADVFFVFDKSLRLKHHCNSPLSRKRK